MPASDHWFTFRIVGVDKASGRETEVTLEAGDEATAKAKAEMQGLVVKQVEVIGDATGEPAASTASEDEAILYDERPVIFRQHPIQVILAIVLIPVAVGIIWLLALWIEALGTRLVLTDRRTTLYRGVLSKSSNEIYHNHVRNVLVSQTFIQRLVGVGTIGIASAGSDDTEITAKGLPNPDKVKSIIYEHRD